MKITGFLVTAVRAIPHITATQQNVYFSVAHHQPGSIVELASLTRLSRSTAHAACEGLVSLGIMRVEETAKKIRPLALLPDACQAKMVTMLRLGFQVSQWKGEFLMKQYLDLIINDYDYIENARPGLLVNPLTGKALEYDRYYPMQATGVEYDGPQHDHSTGRYNSTPEALLSQRQRDLIKELLSKEAKVNLIRVRPADLSLAKMRLLISGAPVNYVDESSHYCRTLDALSLEYVNNPAEGSLDSR
jgi:hypothetical protein